MSIVAISQTLGSLGDEIGRELARTLSWEFADREIIAQAAQRFGEGVLELEHVTEEKPSLWDRFTDTKRRYLTYVEAIIFEMAARDNVILSGRGATIFLRKVRHALRVRITAPERVRAYRVEHQQEVSSEAAVHRVRQNDRERAANVKFLYNVDWDDPLLYDLVLNTERLDAKEGARLLHHALQNERVQPTPESRAELKDLGLTAHAKAALLAHPTTRPLHLSLGCKNGRLSIGGMVEREELKKAVEEIAGKIPGITGVESEIVVLATRRTVAGI
ncbi:MAG: cytidylate kinase-like family protein [Candidatus Rokubacteria bacterium]|nr:cytidylate kinase-like family protein [Candidatus Rokubacteria bacterium]